MKHQIVHTVQKFLLNPPIKLALAVGLPLPGYALLEMKGRKTGKTRRTPVGDGRIGNQFWLVAEHGMKAGYVRNIEHDPRVRLRLREGLRTLWHTGTAHLLPDDDPRERQRWLKSHLPSSAGNARAVRLFGTQLLSIRVDLDLRLRGCSDFLCSLFHWEPGFHPPLLAIGIMCNVCITHGRQFTGGVFAGVSMVVGAVRDDFNILIG